eukprot:4650767-Pleurochrysis_carterae.AAC.1
MASDCVAARGLCLPREQPRGDPGSADTDRSDLCAGSGASGSRPGSYEQSEPGPGRYLSAGGGEVGG